MHHIYQKVKCCAITPSFAAGMSGVALAQNSVTEHRTSPAQNSASDQSDSHDMISQTQQMLKQKGFYAGRVDGIDGPRTRMAIRRYQRSQNLDQTGELNQATMSSLGLSNSQREYRGEASRSSEESRATAKLYHSARKLSRESLAG